MKIEVRMPRVRSYKLFNAHLLKLRVGRREQLVDSSVTQIPDRTPPPSDVAVGLVVDGGGDAVIGDDTEVT